jgi:WD40 repeat protein
VDATTGTVAGRPLAGDSTWPTSLQRSPDGHTFAVAGDSGVTLFDTSSGQPYRHLTATGARVLSMAYSPDGSRIVGGGEDGTLRMWAASDGHLIASVPASSGLVVGVGYAPGGGLVASGGTDGTVRLFDPGTLAPVGRPLPGPDTWAFPAVLDDRTLLAGFADGSVRSYDVAVDAWIDRACAIAGRQLTPAEADEVLPGRQPPNWCPVTS